MHTREIITRWLFKEQWNFTQLPSFAELYAYSYAVLAAASGDGVLHDEERDWIVGYFATLGMSDGDIAAFQRAAAFEMGATMRARLVAFQKTPVGRLSSRGLLFDCIQAAGADADYHDEESQAVHHIGEILGVPDAMISEIEAAYRVQQGARAKKLELLFPEGIPFTQRPSAETSGPPTAREIIAVWRLKDEWGFHQSLSGDELDAYADAVLAAAAGEGVLARSEREWIVGYFATIGMPEAKIETFRDIEVSALAPDLVHRLATYRDTPAGRLSCRALVYDCIRAAGADSEYHVEESARVHHLACMLDIDERVTREMEAIYHDEQEMKAKRLALFFPEGTAFMA
jgi:uncharacterized membrane protein YebE (DUF533 family)